MMGKKRKERFWSDRQKKEKKKSDLHSIGQGIGKEKKRQKKKKAFS